MLYRLHLAAIAILFAIGSLIYFAQIREHSSDPAKYASVIAENRSLESSKKIDIREALQRRSGVQKDIWTIRDGKQAHFQLQCSDSELAILPDKKAAIESLHNLECYSQEEVDLEKNSQEIRVMCSKEGTYFFPSHRFVADEVDLFFYRVPGTELVKPTTAPYLRGKAYDVTGGAENRLIKFKAYHLRAEVIP